MDGHVDTDLLQFLTSTTTELDELINGIESGIDRLFRLAMVIRREARHRENAESVLPAPPAPGDDPSVDNHRKHITDKFEKIRDQPWLQQRLLQAFVQQRGRIIENQRRQRNSHPARHDGVLSTGPEGEGTVTEASVAASTYEERSIDFADDGPRAAASMQSRATSFASVVDIDDDGRVLLPDLEQLIFHGVYLSYDEPFDCPFCRSLVEVRNQEEWR